MNDLLKQVSVIISDLQNGLKSVAPDIVTATGRAIFWQNIVPLVTSLLVLIIALVLLKKYWKVLVKGLACANSTEEAPWILGLGGIVIANIVAVGAFMASWFNPMTWMGIFDQKAYIVAKIIERIGGG